MEKIAIKAVRTKKTGQEYRQIFTVDAENVITDPEHQFVSKKEKEETINATEGVEFSEAEKKENIKSGETLATIFGKICKYLSDLGTAAFKGTSDAVNSTSTTTVATSKALASVNRKIGDIGQQIGDGVITYEGGHYYIQWGADAASKKMLGRNVSDWTVIAEDEFAAGQFDSPAAIVQVEKQYDIKQLTAAYASLTAADFYATVTSVKTAAQIIHSGFDNISYSHGIKSYDVATGILTVFADTWQMTDINLKKGTYLKQTLKIYLCG